jgi:hypothetical protein
MRNTAEINAEIFVAANRRQAIWNAGVRTPDDLFSIRALEQRLANLYEEKRMAMAEDQERAKHRARLDAKVESKTGVPAEKMPWERTIKAPLAGTAKTASMDRTLVRNALVRFREAAA